MEPFSWEQDTALLRLSEWEQLMPSLTCGFTTRLGGTSASPYDTMNCALHVGDVEKSVLSNRRLLVEKLQFTLEEWTCAEQVHGNRIAIVTEKERGRGNESLADAIANADGMVTNEANVLLASFYADCVPLFFMAPEKSVIGIAHAGWKGTATNIAARMVEQFVNRFNVDVQEIRVAIGPSIGGCCYEVDERVAEATHSELSFSNRLICAEKKENGKYMLDLKNTNRLLIEQTGIPAESILVSKWCSSCRDDLFFSYRKGAGTTGRMTAFIGFK